MSTSRKLATLPTNTISKQASKKFYDILKPWQPTMKRQRWLREEENSTAKQFLKSKMLLKHLAMVPNSNNAETNIIWGLGEYMLLDKLSE
jgi:hypothetical protein